jgi:hypothetical protein
MKFSEVIAALEAGKKVQQEGSESYLQIISPNGLKPQLIEIWSNGSWSKTTLEYEGNDLAESSSSTRRRVWSILP